MTLRHFNQADTLEVRFLNNIEFHVEFIFCLYISSCDHSLLCNIRVYKTRSHYNIFLQSFHRTFYYTNRLFPAKYSHYDFFLAHCKLDFPFYNGISYFFLTILLRMLELFACCGLLLLKFKPQQAEVHSRPSGHSKTLENVSYIIGYLICMETFSLELVYTCVFQCASWCKCTYTTSIQVIFPHRISITFLLHTFTLG